MLSARRVGPEPARRCRQSETVLLEPVSHLRRAIVADAPVDEAGQGVGRRLGAQVDFQRDPPGDLRLQAVAFGLGCSLLFGCFLLVADECNFGPEDADGNQDGGDDEANDKTG